jgi:lysophospholipase L1-like esterase
VSPITVDIGGNDFGNYLVSFLSGKAVRNTTMLGRVFPRLAHNWTVIFRSLRTACPACEIIAVNQYNPFPAGKFKVDITTVFATYSTLLKQAAQPFGVRVADVYTPFVGHERAFTWIARGDAHPTTAGYAVMATAVAMATGYPSH